MTENTRVHQLFRIGLWLKAANSLLEIAGAGLLFFRGTADILRLVNWLTQSELMQDPNDAFANSLLHAAERLSGGGTKAAAFFLASHGAIKLALIVGVLLNVPGAYPAFIGALSLLIVYQGYQISHDFSGGLVALTLLDVVVLFLTVHEYRMKSAAESTKAATGQ